MLLRLNTRWRAAQSFQAEWCAVCSPLLDANVDLHNNLVLEGI